MFSRSRRIANVTRAVYAAMGDDLFIEQAGAVKYWEAPTNTFSTIPNASTLANTVTAMPGFLLTSGGGFITKFGGVGVTALDNATITGAVNAATSGGFPTGVRFDIAVEVMPTAGERQRGVKVFTDIGAGQTAPYHFQIQSTTAARYFRVYVREVQVGLYSAYRYVGDNRRADGILMYGVNVLDATTSQQTGAPSNVSAQGMEILLNWTTPAPTTYHQGRVFVAPLNAERVVIAGFDAPLPTFDAVPNRLYFSEITAAATQENPPAFTPLNFIDVPFKVSRRIIALASVGPYLYIFGDRELLVLTGDPATDARIENIGDSIGAISPGSVQQLSGVVFWQSDSGVMAVQGASVKEVGQDVRDALLAMGLNVSTTVDFKREQYVITDGATILIYHAREGGWTQRSVESGGTPSMIYGGGTPYMVQASTLYSIGGESGIDGAPTRMQMRVRWPRYELGSWLNRKVFDGLCVGMDLATQSATINNLTTVDADTLLESDTTLTVTPGNRGAKLHTIKDGIGLQGVTISVELTVDSQDTRAILRPPLVVYGSMSGEESWFDNGI